MKKVLKFFGFTLGSIIILLLLLIGSALWVVFTSERLTPIVREVAKEFIACEHYIGKVELTVFSTFPRFGLAIDSLTVVNPTEGAPSDTLLHIPQAVVTVDVLALLRQQNLSIPTLSASDLYASIYVAADGTNNYSNILSLHPDTTTQADTTAFALPFSRIAVDELTLSAKRLQYVSLNESLHIDLHHAAICAAVNLSNTDSSTITIHQLTAATKQSFVQLNGELTDPLGKLRMDLSADVDVRIADFREFLPEDMNLTGNVHGNISARIHLDDLMAMQLHKGHIAGDIQLKGVSYRAQDIDATLPNNHLTFQIPNLQPSRPEVNWLNATLYAHQTIVAQPITVDFTNTAIQIETNDILNSSPWWHAVLSVQSDRSFHATTDSINVFVTKPQLQAYVAYHTTDTTVMPVLQSTIAFDQLSGYYTDIQANLHASTLSVQLQAPRLETTLTSNHLFAHMADMTVQTDTISIAAAAQYNQSDINNLLLKWNPRLAINMHNATVELPQWQQNIEIPTIDFCYNNKVCTINQSNLIIGNSDFALTGEVRNMARWLRKQGVLEGELIFISQHTDADQLLSLISAPAGTEENTDTLTQCSDETLKQEPQIREPFLVPTNIDLILRTRIQQATAFSHTATNLGGNIYIKNGILVLEELGFICNAAKLQLTAMYRTPRRNHIYLGFDYHMMDINIQELVNLIPQIDSLMPMLRSFKGQAEFHLAAETYTNEHYQIKPSTIRGAASIFGKDLVVLDNETFNTISRLLMFSRKTENKVDSIAAEMTIYKKEIDVYPFCVSMDNYMVALGGRHNLDMTFNYDVNVLSPIYLGVNISGDLDDLRIKLAQCKYAKDFKPLFHRKADTQAAELRSIIRQSMRQNVKYTQNQEGFRE